jgi:hypothetical protein
MKAYFVDIECLLKVTNKAWIIDKSKPNIPIMKISKYDFNLFKSGIYKSQGNKIDFNGQIFWLPTDVYQKLKVKVKNNEASLGNLAVSLQEFVNKELIENIEYEFNLDLIRRLKNKIDDIYVVCSRQTKSSFQTIIDKLEKEMLEDGIQIKKFYFITETFYNETEDSILFKKIRLYLQHLVGYKTDDKKFEDTELTRYDKIMVYDSSRSILNLKQQTNTTLKTILNKSSESLAKVIKENVDEFKPRLEVNYLTDNEINKVQSFEIQLDYSNLIRSFENYCLFFK